MAEIYSEQSYVEGRLAGLLRHSVSIKYFLMVLYVLLLADPLTLIYATMSDNWRTPHLPSFLCCFQLFSFCLVVIKISKRRLFISFLSLMAFVGSVCACVCGGSNLLHLSCANVAQRLTAAQFALLILKDRAGNFVDNLPRFVTIWVSLLPPSLPLLPSSLYLLPSFFGIIKIILF